MYISKQKRLGYRWAIGFNLSKLEHNHAPNPDPFLYNQHCAKRPGYTEALELASTLRGTVGYTGASEILKKKGQEIDRKQYYNLLWKETQGSVTRQEELTLILKVLEDEGVHPRVRDEYIENENGERTQQVVCDLFWMSSEQIRMARRFVSCFMYKTDATFNTNILRLPLGVMVGIDNTRATFPVAYCYITSESAASFKWISEQLTNLAFLDCPEPALICSNFSKGLGAAVAAKATADLAGLPPTDEVKQDRDPLALLEATNVVVREDIGGPELIKLQLCEWHAVEAIKRKLVAVGRYKKDYREELVNMIWAWVKAPTAEDLSKRRGELLKALHVEEQRYIEDYY
jgi:hypothetical protein